MKRNTTIALAFTLGALTTPALAHVSLEQQEARVGATYKAVLRVPHGCGDQATHTLRVQIPEGFINVKPMPKPGWTLETVRGEYESSYDYYGSALSEGVKEIVWSGGNLPNEHYDEFVFRGTFVGSLEPGQSFYFPSVQECADGEEAWIEQTDDHDAPKPAPGVKLLPADHQH
ncbi:YcnI family protein [Szabonella alba]|uniref:DUF1775 domain-containing protein n=1 Tax=Szabonella alba TaxID=2804194 RepID=A0A8K0VBU2_9RHOB|nr:DUF1775 domain-containing protein [Szabonella alba]MBL4916377.1 DUF1775 domain-containing protein [Szabonella alba]